MRRIDQAVNLGNDTCIVSPFNLPGRSSFIEVSSFPKNTGYSLSDIYLKFSLT